MDKELLKQIPDELIEKIALMKAEEIIEDAKKNGHKVISQVESIASQISYRIRNPDVSHGKITIDVMGDVIARSDRTYTSGSSSPLSDVRVKSNVRPIHNALDTVIQLKGVEFDWNEENFPTAVNEAGPNLGFVAQDVKKLVPSLVATDSEGFQRLHYSHITALLVEAIKEQNSTITELQKRIEKMES